MTAPVYDFDSVFQAKITALLLRDTGFAQRAEGLIEASYFTEDCNAALVDTALRHYGKYGKTPDIKLLPSLIKQAVAEKRIRRDLAPELGKSLRSLAKTDISDRDYVLDEIATFARHQAMERAILKSVELLEKREFDKIAEITSQANLVGLSEDIDGISYWDDDEINRRTEYRKMLGAGTIKPDSITTGYPDLDKHLYQNGWGRKELAVIMGAAKAGKSMSLGEFGKNASLAGFNVLYCSLEVSRDIIIDRIDANVSDIAIRTLKDKPFAVEAALKAAAAKAGEFRVHDFPSGAFKVSQLRRLLERYKTRGITFDLVIVDYADIMCPERQQSDPRFESNQIYLDLRAAAHVYDCAMLTATQTNREGAKKMVATATDVAEDFNKIRHADIVLSINATDIEKAAGEARLHFAASRNQKEITLAVKQDREKMKFIKSILGPV